MAYTYLLKCIPTNEYYYGVKYSKGSKPSQLWKTYFSSSNRVHERIKLFGIQAFEYEIRKVFSKPGKALLWEHKVLRRLDAANREDFLNCHDGIGYQKEPYPKIKLWFDDKQKYIDKKLVEYYINQGLASLTKPKERIINE